MTDPIKIPLNWWRDTAYSLSEEDLAAINLPNKSMPITLKQIQDMLPYYGYDYLTNPAVKNMTKKDAMQIEETHTNDRGGKQSAINSRFDLIHLIPEYCYTIVLEILEVGAAKYGRDNWMKIDTEDHINHAIRHLRLWLSGDRSENHLGNASCRCLFALYTANNNE